MDLASFIVGMVVAWIIALLYYGFTVQRPATMRAANTVPLSEHLTRLQEANDRISQLEAELRAEKEARATAEAQAEAELERLRAELAEQQRAAAPRAETVGEPAPDGGPAAETAEAAPEASDLTRVEGIGPQIEEILNNAGIYTFSQLAETHVERLQEILAQAGERYHLADPRTWPEQAGLAASAKWDALAELQDRLKAGR